MRRGFYHIVVTALVALFASSCALNPCHFGFEGVASVDDTTPDTVVAEILVRNDSSSDILVTAGAIKVQLKGDDLITLTLEEPIEIPSIGLSRVSSKWSLRHDDPATLYVMRRHPIERYLDRITIGYELQIEGDNRERRVAHKGIKASKIDMNFENLLR